MSCSRCTVWRDEGTWFTRRCGLCGGVAWGVGNGLCVGLCVALGVGVGASVGCWWFVVCGLGVGVCILVGRCGWVCSRAGSALGDSYEARCRRDLRSPSPDRPKASRYKRGRSLDTAGGALGGSDSGVQWWTCRRCHWHSPSQTARCLAASSCLSTPAVQERAQVHVAAHVRANPAPVVWVAPCSVAARTSVSVATLSHCRFLSATARYCTLLSSEYGAAWPIECWCEERT